MMRMLTTAPAILKAALKLISKPARWTRTTYARDMDGEPCDEQSPDAACWCSFGAVRRYGGFDDGAMVALNALEDEMDGGIAMFNDHKPHRSVVAAFRRAIKRLSTKDRP